MFNLVSNNGQISSYDSADLTSLFNYLMDLCVNQSNAEEQLSVAKLIDSVFNKTVESNPNTYK